MKKTFKVFFSLIIILAVAASVIPVSAASVNDNKKKIYKYLTGELSFNSAAACGIMANMEHESKFDSTVVARDSNGLLSGGLCMWNGSRFSSLQKFCNNNGYNYLSIAGQLEYLAYELKNDYYRHIYNYLRNVSNSANGAADAAYYWCYYFEIPGNRTYQAQKRANSASNSYWPKFGDTSVSAPKISSDRNGKKVDLAKNVTVTVSGSNGNATDIVLLVAEKKNGNFDWNKAKSFSYPVSKSSIKLSCDELGIGEYSVRAYAVNSSSGKKSQNSNTLGFTVDCVKHDMKLTKAKQPTLQSSGSYTYICKKCGLRETVIKDKLSQEKIESSKVENFKAKERTASSVTLKWNAFPSASGYRIYQKIGDEWVKIKTTDGDKLFCKVKNLKSGTKYSFKIIAFVNDQSKTVCSDNAKLSVTTRPEAANITSFGRHQNGKVSIGWDKVKGADGYTVYASTDPHNDYKSVKELKSDKTSCTVDGLKSGQYYYFYVKAFVNSDSSKTYSEKSNVKFALAL